MASTYLAGMIPSRRQSSKAASKSKSNSCLTKLTSSGGPLIPVFHQLGKIALPEDPLHSIIMIVKWKGVFLGRDDEKTLGAVAH